MAKPPKLQSKAARNERRKALAATLNAISVALLAAAFFQPIAGGGALCSDEVGGLTVDPLLYAIIMASVAGAAILVGGWIVSRRNR